MQMMRHGLVALAACLLVALVGVGKRATAQEPGQRGAVTADMALRLSRAFETTPQVWIDLQKDYELWHAATGSHGWKKVKTVELKRSA